MTNSFDLHAAAHAAMLDNGFMPDIPAEVQAEAARAVIPAEAASSGVRDLRALPWSSIDNDDTRDLDQLEMAESLDNGEVRLRIAIADVDSLVPLGSATDRFAAANCTSVYTGVQTFPMLPGEFSTNLTSLGEHADRRVVVVEMIVASDGSVRSSDVYPALVRNQAQLAYPSIGAWLEGHGAAPAAATPEIQAQLRLQDTTATLLRAARARAGSLELDTREARAVPRGDTVDIELVERTRASDLIEDFMIAANVVIAEFLDTSGVASIRRVVREPARWDRIVTLAGRLGTTLPATPDSHALEAFMTNRRQADPSGFQDLSLAMVKLLGPGEYAVHHAGDTGEGHFGLATQNYAHATAPNRRYADLVTQRLLKAVFAHQPTPYTPDQLTEIATHCTEREGAAQKVERQVRKSAAAVSMQDRIGQTFDAIVTGVSRSGTYVRVVRPPVEGRVMRGEQGLDVGDAVRVTLVGADPKRGFIDFAAQ